MDDPDPRLVAAARRGDLDAFETLVRRYQADVWRLSFHFLHDETLADDVTQESFVRVFRFLPRYRGDSKFTTWLFSIARNCALDEIRRSARRKRTTDALELEHTPVPGDPTKRVEVQEALAMLPMDLREPVVWIDMFGISYQEVAHMLKIPVGTVKSRVHRARQLLVERLAENEEEQGEA